MYYPLDVNSFDEVIREEDNVVFLDTARPSDGQRYSLLFIKPIRRYRCVDGRHIGRMLEHLSKEAERFWIAGYCSYEAAYWLEERFAPLRRFRRAPACGDLLWFGVFDEPWIFDHAAGKWNRPLPERLGPAARSLPSGKSPPLRTRRLITRHRYSSALSRIRKFIAAGDVYQVNFTFDVAVSSPLRPWELYQELRKNQPVPFGAFIRTRKVTVVSFSPELFFLRQGGRILVRPMKGTAPRGRFAGSDDARAAALANDPKNRSENIMIVDLLRNDLGRVCVPGSIAADRMFEVERHPTVFQMTSTVTGRLRKCVSLADTMRALFPCGSVTGAPKIRAMEIINELERGPRGVYCGALGYSSPGGRHAPRQVFSVPIRTLERHAGEETWHCRVGSGVVWDSAAGEEWRECIDKYRFLSPRITDFELFESLLFSRGRFRYLRDHRRRLFGSARHFGFPVTARSWDRAVRCTREELRRQPGRRFKVRIAVQRNGAVSWVCEPIISLTAGRHAAACLCSTPVDPDNPYLYHKTTLRGWYEKSMTGIRRKNCFDVLHVNTRGELTEGARSNIFLKINGILYTPPIACGLLPGVLRGRLLRTGKCREKVMRPEDLEKAETIYCGNSVRGLVEVALFS